MYIIKTLLYIYIFVFVFYFIYIYSKDYYAFLDDEKPESKRRK